MVCFFWHKECNVECKSKLFFALLINVKPLNLVLRQDCYKFVARKENYIQMEIRIVNRSRHSLPQYATAQSAGVDLRANVAEPVILPPMGRALIPTGLFLQLPDGWEAQVRPRSGLAIKNGVTVLNSPGTIDADYRGEVGVVLINLSTEDFVVEDGDRIAQMVFARFEKGEFVEVEALDETERGAGGFGHTGV